MNAPAVLATRIRTQRAIMLFEAPDYDDPAPALRPHWAATDDRCADLPARFTDVDDDLLEAA